MPRDNKIQMTQPLPLVSVIMPCLNSSGTIYNAIESVLSQDYENIELIVIDDGSSDSTLSIIEKFSIADERVKILHNTAKKGVSFARNIGINIAKGKFICFLDSDDYLLSGSIHIRVKAAFEKNAKIVFGPYLRQLPNGKLCKKNTPDRISLKDMLKKNYIGNLTGMYDREAIGKVFQNEIRHEDYLMWCQLLKIANHAYSTGIEPIAVYRVSPSSLSGNKAKAFLWHWNVIRCGLEVNFFYAVYYQAYYFFSSLSERVSLSKKRINK